MSRRGVAFRVGIVAAVVVVAAISSAALHAVPLGQRAGVEAFNWLVGEWERPRRGAMVVERWRSVDGVGLVGETVVVPDDATDEVHTEALLLVEMGADIFYIPRPAENPYPVGFLLISADEGTAVFENTTHDFPQRIIYRRTSPDAMTVSIEGPGDGGQVQRIDFAFVRRR